METEESDQVKIKEEVNDQEEMESDNFVKEEMVFVEMNVKQETIDAEADSLKKTSSGSNTIIHEEITSIEDSSQPNNVNAPTENRVENSPPSNEEILRSTLSDRRPTRTIKAPKQYSPTVYKPGPASRRKQKDDSECEPSTTSAKKQASAVTGSSNMSDHFETATSSKQIHEDFNDVGSDNGDDQDDIDDEEEEMEDDDMEEAEDPENSSYPSLDDSNADGYRPRTRTIPPYKDTNSTHSDERICHRKYSRETLQAALEAVKSGRLSMRKASKEFGVPYSTILRLKTEDNPFKRRGRATLLTGEEEEELIRWIRDRSELGFRVTPTILRSHVQSVMNEKPGSEGGPFKSTPPSRKWFTNFLARHPEIAIRKPETASPGKRVPAHILTQEEDGAYTSGRLPPGGAMYGGALYGEGADGVRRAYFDWRAGPNKSMCLRDDSECAVWLSVENFRSVVGEEVMQLLESDSNVEECSKEFQALHRLWKMFPAQPPDQNPTVAEEEML